MKTLKISKEISLPVDVVTQTIAILAKRRAGKSYTMRRIAEQLLEANQQIVIVDPKGDQWGIRSSGDGKSPGYPIVILGGEHADVPLEVNAGEIVAKLVVEERVSVLLDLSMFRKHEIATFMAIFLENLYRLKAREEYRTPVMLIIDEADAVAPQKPQKGEERMLGAAEDIVRRGGQRGIGCTLVTQRSAVLNKNVLTQAQMLIVLRTIAPQDLAAMKAWIDVHGTLEQGKELMASLPSLPIGDAWFWSPGWPTEAGIFDRSHVLPITTFDSGSTPKPGEKKIVPKNLADVNLDALKKQMAATIEKAKADDPKLLKKRIAELEKQSELEKKHPIKVAVQDAGPMGVSQWMEYGRKYGYAEFFEKRIRKEKDVEFMAERDEFLKHINSMFRVIEAVGKIVKDIKKPDIKQRDSETKKNQETFRPNIIERTFEPQKPLPSEAVKVNQTAEGSMEEVKNIKSGAMKMLNWLAAGSLTKQRLATLSGFSIKGGTFGVYLSQLKRYGWITGADKISITDEGRKFAQPETIPSGDELLQMWKGKFKEGVGRMLQYLYENSYLREVSKEELGNETGFEHTGGTFGVYLSKLKQNGLVQVEDNIIRISEEFFNQ